MTNPFEASEPQPAGQALPTGQRPVTATVFGILNIVFGVLGICGSIASAAMLAAFAIPEMADAMNQAEGMEQFEDPAYRTLLIGQGVMGFCLAIMLITSGIGLLKFKAWGRTLAIWYAIPAILLVIGGTAATYVLVTAPAIAKAAEGPEKMAAIGGMVGGIFGALFGLLYPVLLLIFMNRRTFKEQIGA